MRYTIFIITAILLCTAGYLYFQQQNIPPPPSEPMQTGFYVWQKQWTPAVKEAIHRSREEANHYFVFGGSIDKDWSAFDIHLSDSDWQTLQELDHPITLVYRIFNSNKRWLKKDEYTFMDELFIQPVLGIVGHAKEQGIDIRGIQVDYDCPTSKLRDFSEWLKHFKQNHSDVELSITALPTWMTSRYFDDVVRQTDYYVLQVHSFEMPANAGEVKPIFNHKNFPRYLQTANQTRHPFYLSLPTYGYRVYFDPHGQYLNLSAEGFEPLLQEGYSVETIMADEQALAAVVRSLNAERPLYCKGVIWFRLPVDDDRLNWSWDALQAVMRGEVPPLTFEAEIKEINPQLAEVWVHNTGSQHTPHKIVLELDLNQDAVLAYDMMNGYETMDGLKRITGRAPKQDQAVLACWIRLNPQNKIESNPIKVKNVEVLK